MFCIYNSHDGVNCMWCCGSVGLFCLWCALCTLFMCLHSVLITHSHARAYPAATPSKHIVCAHYRVYRIWCHWTAPDSIKYSLCARAFCCARTVTAAAALAFHLIKWNIIQMIPFRAFIYIYIFCCYYCCCSLSASCCCWHIEHIISAIWREQQQR